METSVIAAMALQRLLYANSANYYRLLKAFTTAENIFQQPPSRLKPYLTDDVAEQLFAYQEQGENCALGQVLTGDIQWIEDSGVTVIDLESKYYPALLKEIHQPPPLLYLWGDPSCLSLPQIAMVGSRHPSLVGQNNAFDFARHLAGVGFAVTSGLALGVDGSAHRGALMANGKTLAVLGTGINITYPKRHQGLAREIVAGGGVLISEFPVGVDVQPSHFPQRNRIISGLSLGVLVVEAAVKSGTLITGRYGVQQNREVFAIPGSIHNPMSRGCHALIREGATLVESAQDIVEHLQGLMAFKQEEITCADAKQTIELERVVKSLNEQQALLFSHLNFEVVSVDTLSIHCGMDVCDTVSNLVTLEIMGLVSQEGGGYRRCR